MRGKLRATIVLMVLVQIPIAPARADETVYMAPWPEASISTTQRTDGTPYSDASSSASADEQEGRYSVAAEARSSLPVPLNLVNGTGLITFELPPFETATGYFEGVVRVRLRGTSYAEALVGSSSALGQLFVRCSEDCGLESSDPFFGGPVANATYSSAGTAISEGAEQNEWRTAEVGFRVASFGRCLDPGAYSITLDISATADASMVSSAQVESDFVLERITLQEKPCPAPPE